MVESERHEGWWWLKEDMFTRQLCKIGLERCGFFLHLGTTSLGCITVQRGDEEARRQFESLSQMLKRDAPRNRMKVEP